MPKDQELLIEILKALVNFPDDVSVDRTVDELGVLISVRVRPEDMGIVIGKAGETAKALRHILRNIGVKEKARVNLKIEEPERNNPEETY